MGDALPTLRNSVTRRRRSMGDPYQEVISLVERSHRQFLEVVKLELEAVGIYDINNVQAVMLFNIGDAEMTVGELTLRGCYLGSNVSYNVKKMVENEYLAHERSVHDRRSIHVRLTEKGVKLRDSLTAMHRRHSELLSQTALGRFSGHRRHASSARALLDPRRRLGAATAAAGNGLFFPAWAALRLIHDLQTGWLWARDRAHVSPRREKVTRGRVRFRTGRNIFTHM